MQPRELETADAPHRPSHGAARVIVVGANRASGSEHVAAILSTSLTIAGLENESVEIVHAGATLQGLHAAAASGAWRFVVVTGGAATMITAAFAVVKAIEARHPGARIELFVTGQEESRAHTAYLRVRAAAERFLGREVGFAGAITDLDAAPVNESDSVDSTRRRATRASRAARMWAARLLAECSEGAWPEAAPSTN